MSNVFGADVEQLRQLGRDLGHQSEQIDSIVSRLSARISNVAWYGPDAQRFTGEWNERLSVQLRTVAEGLRESASQAQRNAQEQEQVSGGGVASGLGGSFGTLPELVPEFTKPGLPDPISIMPNPVRLEPVETLPYPIGSEGVGFDGPTGHAPDEGS